MKTSTYLILTPEIGREGQVIGAKVTGARARQPRNLDGYSVAVRLDLDVASGIFDPPVLTGTVADDRSVVIDGA